MSYRPWKVHERNVAKALGGTRIPRGANFSKSLPDVISEVSFLDKDIILLAECKHFASKPIFNVVSSLLDDKHDTVTIITPDKSNLIFFYIDNIKEIYKKDFYQKKNKTLDKKAPGYVVNYFQQAVGYIDLIFSDVFVKAYIASLFNKTIDRDLTIPIVCLGQKKTSKIICYTEKENIDYINNLVYDKNKRKDSIS